MSARKCMRGSRYLVAGVCLFCISWMVCVNEWHGGVEYERREIGSTMRTIVAYSEEKQAEMDRPSPVTCDRLPGFPDISHDNRSWYSDVPELSWQTVAGTRVSLYAAYYDERAAQRYVRILASFKGRNYSSEQPLFCQTRPLDTYEDSVEVVAAKPLEIWWHEWDVTSAGVETPLLLSCPLTESLSKPSVVSIVKEPCDDPTNAFKLTPTIGKLTYHRNFTICVKDMKFTKDISLNLIEWIEVNKLLGVNMIDIYIDELTKEGEKVLLYYEQQGYVRLFNVPFKHKPGRSLWQRRRDHIITYNDCLYRNIKESKFIVPLDIDEIVLPKIAQTWPKLLERLTSHGWDPLQNSAILIQNVFFFDFYQHKYKNHVSKTKMYMKRDNVRIREERDIDISEIELNDRNKLNEVIDIRESEKEYKTDCGIELPIPKLVRHVVSSAVVSPVGYYSKSLMLTKKVLTAFNHYPLASIGSSGFGWSAPFSEVQLNHYKESCNTTMVAECARYRRTRIDSTALRLREALTGALSAAVCAINNT